jgi:hypothetical protein
MKEAIADQLTATVTLQAAWQLCMFCMPKIVVA